MRILRFTAILVLLFAGCGRSTPVTPSATPTLALTATREVASTVTRKPTLPPPTETAAPSTTPTVPQMVKLAELGKGRISPVFRSPDGKRVIVSGIDGKARWYDAETEQEQGAIEADISDLTFSPNGKLAAIEVFDGFIVVDLDTGRVISNLDGQGRDIRTAPIFSPDSSFVALLKILSSTGSPVSWIEIIRTDGKGSPELLPTLEKYSDMTPPAISPDGTMVAAGSSENLVYIWDSVSGKILRTISTSTTRIYNVAFGGDSHMIASLQLDQTVHVWNPATGELIHSFSNLEQPYSWLRFNQDGWIELGGVVEPASFAIHPTTGASKTLPAETHPTPDPFAVELNQQGYLTDTWGGGSPVVFSPDSRIIAVGRRNILLWDVKTQELITSLPMAGDVIVDCLTFSPDGRRLAAKTIRSFIQVWDVESGQTIFLHTPGLGSNYVSAGNPAFSPDGKQIAFGSGSRIEIWDLQSGKVVKTLSQNNSKDFPSHVAFSADGSRLYAVINQNRAAQVWNLASMTMLSQVGLEERQSSRFTAIDLQPPYFARNNSNNTQAWIEIYNLDTGQVKHLPDEYGMNSPLILSEDGRLLFALAYMDQELTIWETASGRLLYGEPFPYLGEFAVDSDLNLLVASYDGFVKLYDLGQLLSTVEKTATQW